MTKITLCSNMKNFALKFKNVEDRILEKTECLSKRIYLKIKIYFTTNFLI